MRSLPLKSKLTNRPKIDLPPSIAILDIPNDGGDLHCAMFYKGEEYAHGVSAHLSGKTEDEAKDWICKFMEEGRPTYFISKKPSGAIASRFHSFAVGASVATGAEYCMVDTYLDEGEDMFHTLALTARHVLSSYLTQPVPKTSGASNVRHKNTP